MCMQRCVLGIGGLSCGFILVGAKVSAAGECHGPSAAPEQVQLAGAADRAHLVSASFWQLCHRRHCHSLHALGLGCGCASSRMPLPHVGWAYKAVGKSWVAQECIELDQGTRVTLPDEPQKQCRTACKVGASFWEHTCCGYLCLTLWDPCYALSLCLWI